MIVLLVGDIWIEKSHSDFSDGWECHIEEGEIITWQLGSKLFAPYFGGLKVLEEDWDLDNNGRFDIVISDKSLNKVIIYWNQGIFSSSNKTVLPASGPQGVTLSDVNLDGFTDIIVANLLPPSSHSFIYYGQENGFNPDNRDAVISLGAQQVLTADINNDGYIDLVVSNSGDGNSYLVDSYIYYGPGPFEGRFPDVVLPTPSAHEVSLVDINKDTYLDILFSSERNGEGGFETFLTVYLGSHAGYNIENKVEFPVTLNWSHSIADLDRDGFLDIVINEGDGIQDKIIWGSPGSIGGNLTYLLGSNPGQISIKDLNRDGNLDVVISEIGGPLYIWWGPQYTNRLELATHGGHGLMIADYDLNGYPDIALAEEGNSKLKIYWNGTSGFQPSNFTELPAGEPDDCIYKDLGNLWDRTNNFCYLSSLFDTHDTVRVDSVKWWGVFSGETEIEVWIRGGLEEDQLSSWVRVNYGESIDLNLLRFLQYRITFKVDERYADRFSFDSIKVYYHRPVSFLAGISIFPDQSDSIDSGAFHEYLLTVENLGELEDVADLTFTSTGTEWDVQLMEVTGIYPLSDTDGDGVPDTGPISPEGGEAFLKVIITSPLNAEEGDVDTTIVWAYSSRDPAIYDSAILITKIRRWVTILVEPDSKDSTEPGEPIFYPLYVVNKGNLPDIPDLYIENIDSLWHAEILNFDKSSLFDTDGDGNPDAGILQPGDTFDFILSVTPYPGALPGETDTFVIWGRSSIDTVVKDGARIESKVKGRLLFDLDVENEGYISIKGGRIYPGRVIEEGIEGDTVELKIEGSLEGWEVTFIDSAGRELLDADEDGWFELGPLKNRVWKNFGIRVIAEERGDSLYFTIHARSKAYPFLFDSAFIITKVIRKLLVYNFGNPFQPGIYFKLVVPQSGNVTLSIYNRLGELIKEVVKDSYYKAGEYRLYWDGTNKRGERVVPGVYIYILEFTGELGGKEKVVKKIIKLK